VRWVLGGAVEIGPEALSAMTGGRAGLSYSPLLTSLIFTPMTNRERLLQKFEEEYKKLNPEQKKAVDQTEGPVMVIAGPGTGKTQILSARIGRILLSDAGVEPHNILCLTYTDAGVVAMRRRLAGFIGPDAYRVAIYTFHAFCNDVIQDNLGL